MGSTHSKIHVDLDTVSREELINDLKMLFEADNRNLPLSGYSQSLRALAQHIKHSNQIEKEFQTHHLKYEVTMNTIIHQKEKIQQLLQLEKEKNDKLMKENDKLMKENYYLHHKMIPSHTFPL